MRFSKQLIALGATAILGSSAFAQTNVTADITANEKWTVTNSPYILDKVIYVKSGATLDIEPGVLIRGQPRISTLDTAGGLVITKTGKIQARGTAAAPIIFTTAVLSNGARWVSGTPVPFLDANPATAPLPPLLDLDGDTAVDDKVMRLWTGLVICGDSLTNNYQDVDGDTIPEDGQGLIEGLTGADAIYGGLNSEHNGGTVKFVSIRHGGDGVVDAQEINALTLYAVGSKTTISNIDIYCTSDDGVEIFGGTVNLSYLNINYADDDGLDTDEGYQGTNQFVFVLQGFGYGDKGMELDGDEWDVNQALSPVFPVSDVRIYNATVVTEGKNGTDIRNGFSGSLVNSIFRNRTSGGTGVSISGLVTGDQAPSPIDFFNAGSFQVRNVTSGGYVTDYSGIGTTIVLSTAGAVTGTFAGEAIPSVFYPSTTNRSGTTSFALLNSFSFNDSNAGGIDPVPAVGSAGAGGAQGFDYVPSPVLFTDYRGAFNPAAASQWTFGWTALNIRGILVN